MEKNRKILVSDEVADFIKSYNAESIHSQKTDKSVTMYWNECRYISTDEDNIFEVIFPRDINSELLNNRLKDE